MSKQTLWPTIIVGAGAAGLMCAGSIKTPKLVLEHNAVAGRKLNITGGGKCNFTNRFISASDYRCGQKHFCHNALAAYPPESFLHLLQAAGIPYTETTNGCFFARQATDITKWLLQRCKQNHTSFSFNTQVLAIHRHANQFIIRTSNGTLETQRLVLATGGMSYPQVGATSFTWKAAAQLGLPTRPPEPALVGLRADALFRPICRSLAGNSLPVILRQGKRRETGPLLFTHDGISGPAVLQLSLYVKPNDPLFINFVPTIPIEIYLREHKQENKRFSALLQPYLSAKISRLLLGTLDIPAANASKHQIRQVLEQLQDFRFQPDGTAGFTKAEVTAGGIDVSCVHPTTLQCRTIPGLFIIGEALDVTGRMGGFNLHWAWASANMAADTLNKIG